jgi:SagB-type dehydrogenase family enzyme
VTLPDEAAAGLTHADVETVYRYHDGTKHHFDRFARSLGYLDWASQPRPFRSYLGSPRLALERHPASSAGGAGEPPAGYDDLFVPGRIQPAPVTLAAIGDMLRHALGLSAWKVLGASRWALRSNPSSGNLHPTEAYVISGPLAGLSTDSSVWHYAPEDHAVEQRCRFSAGAWPFDGELGPAFLVALTSIHWRESWKYGERGFRYCQHDLGHAIGALSLAGAANGWTLAIAPRCPHQQLAALIGIDREEDFVEAEREEAGCLLLVSPDSSRHQDLQAQLERLVAAARGGHWSGRASQLSEDHVQWTFIDEVAAATRHQVLPRYAEAERGGDGAMPVAVAPATIGTGRRVDARGLMLQRRSAVALDGLSSIDASVFFQILARLESGAPSVTPPWTALWWAPRIHLAIFVHRVIGLEPGLYFLLRHSAARSRVEAAFNPGFEWERVDPRLPLYRLARGPFRVHAQRLSCDQAIAADGFFSLAMIADFARSITEHGPSFYRHLFWEAGVIGQVLYLEAEAAGTRGTGIGCFYDDAVHDTLGLHGHAFQSLYHFTVGIPVEDRRLTTEAGYPIR